jgi:hypothetical protein
MLGQMFAKVHLAGGTRNRLFCSVGFGRLDVTEGVGGNGQHRNTGGLGSLDYLASPGAGIYGQLQNDPIPLPPASAPVGAMNAVALPVSQIPDAVASLNIGMPFAYGNATFIPADGDPDLYRTVQFISRLIYLEQQIRPNFHYRINIQDLVTNRNYVDGPQDLGYQPPDRISTKYNGRTDTVNATLEWLPFTSQLFSGGYEFERETYASPSYTGQVPASLSSTRTLQSSSAVFVQDQMRLYFEDGFPTPGFVAKGGMQFSF